jgi:hypothetical protein
VFPDANHWRVDDAGPVTVGQVIVNLCGVREEN